MHFLRRYRDVLISIALLVLPFLFLNSNLKAPDELNALDRVILQISTPIQWVAAAIARGASDVWDRYVYLLETRAENERLQRELSRAREENRRLSMAADEARGLRKMLGFRDAFEGELIAARVIAKDTTRFFRVVRLRIDRNATEVRSGMPVLTHDGLVGQVQRTWDEFSDVRLVVDPASRVDVVVQRTMSRGTLRGTGDLSSYACRIEHLRRTDEVRVGDLVFTSGAGRRFPRGILVGRVTRLRRQEFGLYQEAEVTPAVDMSRLNHVFVFTAAARADLDDAGSPLGEPIGESGD